MIASIADMVLTVRSASVLELLLGNFWSDPTLFADFFPTVGVNIFIPVTFVFLYFFAKICFIDLAIACGRPFPSKKLICFCVELWDTNPNVVTDLWDISSRYDGYDRRNQFSYGRFDRYNRFDRATPIATIVEIEIFLSVIVIAEIVTIATISKQSDSLMIARIAGRISQRSQRS